MIIAVDPAPSHVAIVAYDHRAPSVTRRDLMFATMGTVRGHAYLPTDEAIEKLRRCARDPRHLLVIEMVANYGKGVGESTFKTCVVIGRIEQVWREAAGGDVRKARIMRSTVKGWLRAQGDGGVRAAILDMYGGAKAALGHKSKPGPLYGISGDKWAALAVAIVFAEKNLIPTRATPSTALPAQIP